MNRTSDPLEIFRQALRQDCDAKVLDKVGQHSKEILDALDGLSDEESTQFYEGLQQVSPERLAAVYAAVSGAQEADPQTPEGLSEIGQELLQEGIAWERHVGLAFRDALVPPLPPLLLDVRTWFRDLPMLERDSTRLELLRESPAVQAGGLFAQQLAEYGITPVTVLQAIDGVHVLIFRLLRNGFLTKDKTILLTTDGIEATPDIQSVAPSYVIGAIERYASCPREMAQCLFRWLIPVAQRHQKLFLSLEGEPFGKGVALRVVDQEIRDVLIRWSPSQKKVIVVIHGFASGRSDAKPEVQIAALEGME